MPNLTLQETLNDKLEKNLNTLLTEANNRTRWYSSQLWQLPFAYIGLTAIAIAQFMESMDGRSKLVYLVTFNAIIGITVIWHMNKVKKAQLRAIDVLIFLEEQSGLPKEHQAKKIEEVAKPMTYIAKGTTIVYAIWAIFLWWTVFRRLCGSF